jgi:hypothetical protein
VTNDRLPRVVINEFYAAATGAQTNWIELFNPAFVPLDCGRLEIRARDSQQFKQLSAGTNIPPRGYVQFFGRTNLGGLNMGNVMSSAGNIVVRGFTDHQEITRYPYTNETINVSEGPAWDGGPRGYLSPTTPCSGAKYASTNLTFPWTPRANNDYTSRHRYFTATPEVNATNNYLAWQDIGLLPATYAYSPKQHDFHSMNVEDIAFRSTSEIIIGLRAPLTNRITGNAYYFRVNNLTTFTNYWDLGYGAGMQGIAGPYSLDLGGLGFRSIKWCPNGLTNAQGSAAQRYLILAGTANGGPLQREQYRQKFSLYSWTGNTNNAPTKLIDDLWRYTLRPEGVDLIQVGAAWRILFVEDRFLATGYGTRNAIHWPLSIVGPVP